MKNLTIAFAFAATIGFAVFTPFAQGAPANFGALAHQSVGNPFEPAACRGRWGAHCPPGRHWVCGPYGHRCWCAPC